MGNDRGQPGPENDLQRRELQARYLQDSVGSARASRRLRRAIAGLGVATLALIAFTSFSPPRGSVTPERSSISPSEITATLSDIPNRNGGTLTEDGRCRGAAWPCLGDVGTKGV
jgi:hypothetical protein